MSLAKIIENKISESDYLEAEHLSKIKHEYIDGSIYAMSGASKNHNRISQNISRELGLLFKQKKSVCEVFSSDMKIRQSDKTTKYFYPDVVVSCDPDNNESEYYINSPLIIFEVLSKATRRYDLTDKKLYYFNIPSLQEYIVIEQDFCRIEVFKKSDHWRVSSYFLGDSIHLASLDIELSVADIYYQVVNEDMLKLLQKEDHS